jgi:uncharacterized coiled-coil protein SlyX
MATITISSETLEDLQKLADAQQVSIQELADAVLANYINAQPLDMDLTQEELDAVDEAIAQDEADEAAGLSPITQEDMYQMLHDMVAEHQAKLDAKKA